MAGLSSATLAKIDGALKRANTRIARLEDAFGRNSSTFKNNIATFEKGGLNKYVGTSSSGHWKLDKGKIMGDIRSGKLSLDEANEILRNSAGVQITKAGDMGESNYTGFQTRKEILDQTMEAIESGSYDLRSFQDKNGFIDLNKKTLFKIAEELNKIAESFQTEYDETGLSNEEIKSDPILSDLFNEDHGGTRSKRQLTYTELQDMAERLAQIRQDMEDDQLRGKMNSDFLSNKAGE